MVSLGGVMVSTTLAAISQSRHACSHQSKELSDFYIRIRTKASTCRPLHATPKSGEPFHLIEHSHQSSGEVEDGPDLGVLVSTFWLTYRICHFFNHANNSSYGSENAQQCHSRSSNIHASTCLAILSSHIPRVAYMYKLAVNTTSLRINSLAFSIF